MGQLGVAGWHQTRYRRLAAESDRKSRLPEKRRGGGNSGGCELLVRPGEEPELVRKPVRAEASEEARAGLAECIGISATRAVNREMGVVLESSPCGREK